MNKARVKSMKKFWLVLSLAMFCLIVGSLWEFSLNDWSADKKFSRTVEIRGEAA